MTDEVEHEVKEEVKGQAEEETTGTGLPQGGEQDDGSPVLFVSHFPKSLSEDDCKTMFERYGAVTLFVLCKDRATGASKGSGFLRFARQESADRCAAILHEQYTIPGMAAPMIVRPASRPYPGDVAAALLAQGAGARGPAKLFVGHLPSTATEADLRPVFARFGRVLEVVVLRAGAVSRCCGFVNMACAADALCAARALNDRLQLDPASGTVVVRLADGRGHSLHENQNQQQPFTGGATTTTTTTTPTTQPQYGHSYSPARSARPRQRQGPPGANLYVRGLPRDLTDEGLARAFAPFGALVSAKVFVDPVSRESRGFGFVSFESVAAAQHAVAQMHGTELAPGVPLCVQPKSEPGAFPAYAPYVPQQFFGMQMQPPPQPPPQQQPPPSPY